MNKLKDALGIPDVTQMAVGQVAWETWLSENCWMFLWENANFTQTEHPEIIFYLDNLEEIIDQSVKILTKEEKIWLNTVIKAAKSQGFKYICFHT